MDEDCQDLEKSSQKMQYNALYLFNQMGIWALHNF